MSGERRFRFGAVAGFGRTGQEWAATARRLEQLGFGTLRAWTCSAAAGSS
jgi:hypothetical protein